MAQDVREIIPRVRRALEGPVPLATGALTDDQLLAVTADAIADVILFTGGEWNHTLAVSDVSDDDPPVPSEWEVDPELTIIEESVVAYQAALTYTFQTFKNVKTSERIKNEGQEWEYTVSATVVRDFIKSLIDLRNQALASSHSPVMARYASILQVRDAAASFYLEPWVPGGGLGGGQALLP
jgi:hypothetical protein